MTEFYFTYNGFRTIYSCHVDHLGQHYIYAGDKFANIIMQRDDFSNLVQQGKILKMAKGEEENEAA